MDFLMYSTQTVENDEILKNKEYDVAIVGQSIDDRGGVAGKYLSDKCKEILEVKYNPDNLEVVVDGKKIYSTEEFKKFLLENTKNKKVLIESTTIGFAEIFLCVSSLIKERNIAVDFLYIEPLSYRKTWDINSEKNAATYELSNECGAFIGIPGAATNISAEEINKGIFFLGYEDHRFNRIFEELDGDKPAKKCPVVFGVPPFQIGWELDSFSANCKTLNDKSINDGVYYCPANNPLSVYELLEEHYASEQDSKIFISPLGTKPESIGIAVFVAEKNFIQNVMPQIGILYDHPIKKKGRSDSVHKWHLYSLIR